jgi:hypothetical protein
MKHSAQDFWRIFRRSRKGVNQVLIYFVEKGGRGMTIFRGFNFRTSRGGSEMQPKRGKYIPLMFIF